jgi:hypothetical protein
MGMATDLVKAMEIRAPKQLAQRFPIADPPPAANAILMNANIVRVHVVKTGKGGG